MYPGAQLSQHITIHDVTSAHARNEHIHVQVCENRTHDPTLLGGYVQYCTTPWPTDSHSVTTINLYWSIVSYRVKRRIKNTDEVPSRLSSPKTINKTGGGAHTRGSGGFLKALDLFPQTHRSASQHSALSLLVRYRENSLGHLHVRVFSSCAFQGRKQCVHEEFCAL